MNLDLKSMRAMALAFIVLVLSHIGVGDSSDNASIELSIDSAKEMIEKQKIEEAIQILINFLNERPTNVEALCLMGDALLRQKKYRESIDYYNKVLLINDNNLSAYYGKCRCLIGLSECDEVKSFCTRLPGEDPESEVAHQLAGIALTLPECNLGSYSGNDRLDYGPYNQALEYYNKSIALNNNSTSAWNNKGIALGELGRLNESIVCFNEAIIINSSFAAAWNNKGVSLDYLNLHRESIECYNQAINLSPLLAEAWYNKGLTLALNFSTYDIGRKCYNISIMIDPNMKGQIGWVYRKTIPSFPVN